MARVVKIVLGIVLVVLIGLVIFVNTLDINQYKGDIIQAAEQATGRKLTIDGDMQLSLFFSPSIKVQNVTFSNAAWGSKPNMLSMHEMQLQLGLLPLLTGHIQINRLVLIDPDILLETNKKGVGNWQFSSPNKAAKSAKNASSVPAVSISDVKMQNAKISYINGQTGKKDQLDINEIETKSSGFDAPLSVLAKASLNGTPLKLSGKLGSITQWQSDNQFPVDLALALGDNAKLTLKGSIDAPVTQPKINLAINGSITSLASLNKLAQSKLPDMGPFKLTTQLNGTQKVFTLSNLKLLVGQTTVSGVIKADLTGKKPDISGNIQTKLVDFAAIAGEKAQASQKTKPGKRIFSSAPLPLHSLQNVNANIHLNADQIKTKSITLNKTQLGISLKNGVLTIKPLSSVIAGGNLAGSINMDASGKSATLAADITIKGLQPGQIGELAKHIADAKTDVDINIKGSGQSISQIMAGLNGKVLVHSGKGILKVSGANLVGTDILTMLNPTVKSGKDTKMLCAVVNFNVKNGLATTDKGIALMTDQMNVVGSGTIDLKTEKLDIGLKPHAREGLGVSVGQLADFVRVGGTLADPQPTTDVKSALSTGLKVQTAVATGGLSLLAQGLFDRITADDNPCNTALGIKTSSSDNKTDNTNKPDMTTKPAKETGSSITDKIKSLF